MESSSVLIISDSPLFVDAVGRLLEAENIRVVVETEDLELARTILDTQAVDAIVVDQDSPLLQQTNALAHLMDYQEERHVIFLTLADNRMTVHHQERVENVTPADLVGAIRNTK